MIGAGSILHNKQSDYYAWREDRYHKGVDISGGDGKSYFVFSPVFGTVVYSAPSPTFRPYVVVVRATDGMYHRFGHLSPDGALPVGTIVVPFSRIGRTASTRENKANAKKLKIDSDMPAHVHYEITDHGPLPNPERFPSGYRDPVRFLVNGEYHTKPYKRKYPLRLEFHQF